MKRGIAWTVIYVAGCGMAWLGFAVPPIGIALLLFASAAVIAWAGMVLLND